MSIGNAQACAERVLVDEAIHGEAGAARVDADRDVEALGRLVEREDGRVVEVAAGDRAVQGQRDRPELAHGPGRLGHRVVDRRERQRGRRPQPLGVRRAVGGEPVVERTAAGHLEAGVTDRPQPEGERAIEDGDVDALAVHVGEPGVWIDPARAVERRLLEALGCPRAAAGAGRHEPAVERVPRRSTIVADDARPAVQERRVEVLFPRLVGLPDVPVDVDDDRVLVERC